MHNCAIETVERSHVANRADRGQDQIDPLVLAVRCDHKAVTGETNYDEIGQPGCGEIAIFGRAITLGIDERSVLRDFGGDLMVIDHGDIEAEFPSPGDEIEIVATTIDCDQQRYSVGHGPIDDIRA
jgi:hypothetical protein